MVDFACYQVALIAKRIRKILVITVRYYIIIKETSKIAYPRVNNLPIYMSCTELHCRVYASKRVSTIFKVFLKSLEIKPCYLK